MLAESEGHGEGTAHVATSHTRLDTRGGPCVAPCVANIDLYYLISESSLFRPKAKHPSILFYLNLI
jgi:hypothetical protein